MKFKIKKFKYLKVKNYIKDIDCFLIFNGTNTKEFVKMNQILKNLNLKYYKISNTLTKKVLNKSIYKNFKPLINSLIILLRFNNNNLNLKQLLNIDNSLKFIGLKIHNKIYVNAVLNILTVKNINYTYANLAFLKLLKTCLKITFKINL